VAHGDLLRHADAGEVLALEGVGVDLAEQAVEVRVEPPGRGRLLRHQTRGFQLLGCREP